MTYSTLAEDFTISLTDDEDLSGVASGAGSTAGINARMAPFSTTTHSPDDNQTSYLADSTEGYAPTYKASITLMIVVSVIAFLVLMTFALLTVRYHLGQKGSYYSGELKREKNAKDVEGATSDNVFDQPTSKEFML